MAISTGNRLPEANLLRLGEDGPETIALGELTQGRKVAIFAVPGAFTPTCSSAHMPSFLRNKEAFREKGIDDIICVSVNDVFVMDAWGRETGATEAGFVMLSDADGSFTKKIGLDFTAPAKGMIGRSKRYAMIVEDGIVQTLNVEASPGECEISAGEELLDAL